MKSQNTVPKSSHKKKSNILLNVIIILLIVVFIVALVVAGKYAWNYIQASQTNDDIRRLISTSTETHSSNGAKSDSNLNASGDSNNNTESDRDGSRGNVAQLPNFSQLISANDDFVGWVKIPGTTIDNPIVQTSDNEMYLTTDFFGKHSPLGTVFSDYRTSITADDSSDNIVLYGHSGRNNSFFSDVRKYRSQEFLNANPIISFDTRYEAASWVVMAGFSYDANDLSNSNFHYINYIDLSNEAVYDSFIDQINARALSKSDVDIKHGDKFITLSTCDYTFENERFVITARKLRDGEAVSNFIR